MRSQHQQGKNCYCEPVTVNREVSDEYNAHDKRTKKKSFQTKKKSFQQEFGPKSQFLMKNQAMKRLRLGLRRTRNKQAKKDNMLVRVDGGARQRVSVKHGT